LPMGKIPLSGKQGNQACEPYKYFFHAILTNY
jgi:hypothetical protein